MKTFSFSFLIASFFFFSLTVKSQNISNKYSKETHIEWEKLQAFKKELDTSFYSQQNYLTKLRTYSKDSIKILTVKLLGIKELHKNELLLKDISLNKTYYTTILKELKSSNINPKEYLFLENMLALSSKNEIEEKYIISKWVNIFLCCIILSLLFFIFSKKRKKDTSSISKLSKQEINIQKLIVQGKTNKEISEELFISLSTVKTHITNIYHKLNISNRSELVLKFKKQH